MPAFLQYELIIPAPSVERVSRTIYINAITHEIYLIYDQSIREYLLGKGDSFYLHGALWVAHVIQVESHNGIKVTGLFIRCARFHKLPCRQKKTRLQ